ncbi:hypothetical protein EOI86_04620 [Hwanghaeella grinnelliae]|uniref:Novel toxin 16 domain-containing protein n=1 Tax=Hwanghaeella grinnelliae TaxID=2500179 RepID=A0A3S2ZB82_9PROT|nr:hypothetical protein [Hwanghaeella grinnelliae]RVU38569.1 hypothetical protein EOI86_04620 [Hwanghaeella grinnelliae]
MTRLMSAAFVALAVLASVTGAKAQSDNSVVNEMARNTAACANWAEIDCMNVCNTAYRSFSDKVAGDPAAIADCRASYGPAKTRGEAKLKAEADERAVRNEVQQLIMQCGGENRGACMNACRKASKRPGDSALVESCRAAQPAPGTPPKPEDTMSFAQRAAAREGKAAYCEAKKNGGGLARGDRRQLEHCISTCRDPRVFDDRFPQSQRDTFLATCEQFYDILRAHFKD